MIEITKPADRGNGQTGFVGVTGGVKNCLNNTTSLNNNQAISTTSTPLLKAETYFKILAWVMTPFAVLQLFNLVDMLFRAVFQ